jgi:hypothetical protein
MICAKISRTLVAEQSVLSGYCIQQVCASNIRYSCTAILLNITKIACSALFLSCVLLILTSERILVAGGNQRNNVRVELNDSVLNGLRKEGSQSDRLTSIAFITKLPIIAYDSQCN